MIPQLGVGGATPNPKNPKPASNKIAAAKFVVASTESEPFRLGKICLNMIWKEENPVILADKINSLFFNCIVCPLTTLATSTQLLRPVASKTWKYPLPKKKLKPSAIKRVGKKNIQQIFEWQKKYPEYNDPESKQNDKYLKMLCNAMNGSTDDEQEKNMDKIIRNITKEVVIDKQLIKTM